MTRPIDLSGPQARFAARVLIDTCEIKALDQTPVDPTDSIGEEPFNEDTGTYGPAAAGQPGDEPARDVDVYAGACAVFPAPMNRLRQSQGEIYVGPERQYEAQLPIAVTDVRRGHVLKVTMSRNDPGLPGRFFLVGDDLASTLPIARQLQLTEITEGEQLFGRW
jgi:hypothetical protein